MQTPEEIIATAIDTYIENQNSFYEGFVKPYLPDLSKYIVKCLDAGGFKIVAK